MYTAHGHHIPHSPDDGTPLPDHKDDCGGIEACVDCAREAIPYLPIEPDATAEELREALTDRFEAESQDEYVAGFVEPITDGLPDESLEEALDAEEDPILAVDADFQKLLDEEEEIERRHAAPTHEDRIVDAIKNPGSPWDIENGEEPVVGNAARQRFVTDFLNQDRSNFGEHDIRDRFGRHEVTDITFPMNAACRGMFIDVALILDKMLPPGREKFQALVDLEKAETWALKAIATLAPVVEEE